MTYLNYWHYISFGIIFIIFILGMISAFKQESKKIASQMFVINIVVSILFIVVAIFVVDKYTKKVELGKVKNRRLLSTEQIVYYGIVKNTGDFTVGTVTFEVKLVNKGNAIGKLKGQSFYKSSGLLGFFEQGFELMDFSKPQTVTQTFTIAENLEPGTAKQFRVYFKYPGYFSSVAQYTKVYGR